MPIEDLVAAVQGGDQSLMEELWGAVVNLIKWKAKRVMMHLEVLSDSHRIEFEDLVQSGYFALVRALETYRPECGAFSSWLMLHLQSALWRIECLLHEFFCVQVMTSKTGIY